MARSTGAAPIERPNDAENLDYQGLDSLLGYCVRRAHGAIHRDFIAAMGDLNLTQKQAATLWLIGANGGVSQVMLAACLGMDRATMMSVVDRLEERGFVIRKRSTTDRRRQELHLTPAGQGTLRKARSRIAEHERRFVGRLKPTELATLLALLRKLADA